MSVLDLPQAAIVALALVIVGAIAVRVISILSGWAPAGPIALLAGAPLVPTVQIVAHLSTDDLLPLLGLAMLLWRSGWSPPRGGVLARVALVAVVAATSARVVASAVNGSDAWGVTTMLIEAVARPAVLTATAILVATTLPREIRQRVAAVSLACVGTFEGAFGVVAFTVSLPGRIGIQPERLLETLGGCTGRVTGTLGLSPNHIGAVFVVTIPMTLAVAIDERGWRRWAWVAASGLQAAALMLTFTRSSIVLAALAAFAFLVYRRQLVVLAAGLVLTAVFTMVVTGAACPTAIQPPQPSTSGGPSAAVQPSSEPLGPAILDRFGDQNDRLALWYSAARIMFDHPLAGVGLGQMPATIAANPAAYRATPFGPATSSAHNTILLAGAETGILGALAMLVVNSALVLIALGWVVREGNSALQTAAAVAVIAFLAQGMVNNLLTVPATATLLSLLVGAFVGERARVFPRIPSRAAG